VGYLIFYQTLCQLSFNSQNANMLFAQVQKAFVVTHYLASHSYVTCNKKFRDAFHDSAVPNISSVSCPGECL
jgi:hypothetical protein